jgi:ankyrin repeat protein
MGFREVTLVAVAAWLIGFAQANAGPLHDAARSGYLDQLKTLLDSGASIEDRDGTKETPLISAALSGQTAVVEELIKRGADVMARNDRGLTPLHAAAYSGDFDSARLLVKAGAAVNDAEGKFGVTPLIVAAEENRIEIVEFLLDHGADTSLQERHHYTALTRAGFKAHWEVVQVLLKNGAVCQAADVAGPEWNTECNKRMAELPQ